MLNVDLGIDVLLICDLLNGEWIVDGLLIDGLWTDDLPNDDVLAVIDLFNYGVCMDDLINDDLYM